MSNTTFTTEQIQTLIAAGIDLNEFFGKSATPDTPAPKKDGRNKAARKHNYEARMARRQQGGARGLTKGEKSALYASLAVNKRTGKPTQAAWDGICAEFKASGLTVDAFLAGR